MLNSFRIIAIAIMLTTQTLGSSAQEIQKTNTEIDNINPQQTSSLEVNQSSTLKISDLNNITSTLEKIDNAIRSLKIETDYQKEKIKELREKEDLKAQQDMSQWAFWTMISNWAMFALTVIMVIFIYKTTYYTKDILKEAKETTKAAQDQLLLSTPPTLRVNKVRIWPENDKSQGLVLKPGQRIEGHAWVYNAGRDRALISKSQLKVRWYGKQLPMISPLEDETIYFTISKQTLCNGEADKWIFYTEVPDNYDASNMFLYVIGEVIYYNKDDTDSIRRHVAFGRRYDPEKGRFEKSDDPDYEIEI